MASTRIPAGKGSPFSISKNRGNTYSARPAVPGGSTKYL